MPPFDCQNLRLKIENQGDFCVKQKSARNERFFCVANRLTETHHEGCARMHF